MSAGSPPGTPSGLWRSTGASTDLFEATRAKLALDIAAKDKLYRWDIPAEVQTFIVRLAMQSCANIAFELRQQWNNAATTQDQYDEPTGPQGKKL